MPPRVKGKKTGGSQFNVLDDFLEKSSAPATEDIIATTKEG